MGNVTDPRDPAAPASPETQLGALLGGDASDLEAKIDPPAPAGDLKSEIDRFTTIDACVDERARVDPILGDALEAIGYDTFLRDACRVIDAAKAGDANRCTAIDASSLEARCRATVAELSGTPEACPWEAATRRARGRDAKCLAIASRDARLCAGITDVLDRATCEATLDPLDPVSHGPRRCAPLRGPSERARCARDAERWRGVVSSLPSGPNAASAPNAAPADAEPFVVQATLHVEGTDTSVPGSPKPIGEPLDVDLAPDLARGVTVVVQRDGARIVLGPLTDAGLDFIAPSPHTKASLALELVVPIAPTVPKPPVRPASRAPSDAATPARIERAELLLPGRSPLSTPGVRSTLVATVDEVTHAPGLARASSIKVEVTGDLEIAGATWHVRLEATTFVRDVVKAVDLYDLRPIHGSPSAGSFGDDAGMR